MKSCFFICHREATMDLYPQLFEAVVRHVQCLGVKEFVVGHYGGFDDLAAKAVLEAKSFYPDIFLTMLIPYHPTLRPVKLPEGFNNSFYPPNMEFVPKRLAIVCANRYMIEHTDYLIAYAWHPASNARDLVEYARKKGIVITELSRP